MTTVWNAKDRVRLALAVPVTHLLAGVTGYVEKTDGNRVYVKWSNGYRTVERSDLLLPERRDIDCGDPERKRTDDY